MNQYDYIVVGAGLAGCAIASDRSFVSATFFIHNLEFIL